MNTIHNRQVINDVLVEKAGTDRNIVVLCSDSRGSASLAEYARSPKRFVRPGLPNRIAFDAAGLASCGKKRMSPRLLLLSTRAMEQVRLTCLFQHERQTVGFPVASVMGSRHDHHLPMISRHWFPSKHGV
jgi:transketolase